MATTPELRSLGRAMAEAQDAAIAGRERPAIDERLARIHAEGRARRGAARRRIVGAAIAFAAVAAAASSWPRSRPLRFAVGDAPAVAGAWVAAPPDAPATIGFSDGTRLTLDAGGRARVVSVGERGARVLVERGVVHADVVHRPDNEWRVTTGPFEIHVTGTRFDARWDPQREELFVIMHQGRVAVRAACFDGERILAGNDKAALTCAPQVSAPPRAAAPPSAPPRAPESATVPAPAAPRPPSWRELARGGAYKQALATAEAAGFARLCAELSAVDLMELAAAARLGGRADRAAEAYAAVRRRFPGGHEAATAAFHLGQMAFDGAGAFAEAHRWFQVYLTEQPGGALAAEALGRLMEAEQRLGDLAAARASAERYLARFPDGAHAALARSLVAP